jgi:UDP-N-acetylglucosamine 2-epimerase (non-hydrolysing)
MSRVFLVAGARPNFMKIAPLFRRLSAAPAMPEMPAMDVQIVHTGQHYDEVMSEVFFRQLGLPAPHISLAVGSAPHGAQTGRVLEQFESALMEHRPAAVVVVGDVNSTLACALATAKVQFPDGSRPLLAHVEAGLRSGDRSMPEEVNRVLTDAISDVLFTLDRSARISRIRQPHVGCPGRLDRLGRLAGGIDVPPCAVPHAARQHRASGDDLVRYEHTGRPPARRSCPYDLRHAGAS